MHGRVGLFLLVNTMAAGAASVAGFREPVPMAPSSLLPAVSISIPDPSHAVLAIENDSGQVLQATWSGEGVDADPTLSPGEMLLAVPEAVPRIVFRARTGPSWHYAFDGDGVDWRSLRRYGFRRDELDPYLFFLRISRGRRLAIAPGNPRGAPVIAGFPAAPRFVRTH